MARRDHRCSVNDRPAGPRVGTACQHSSVIYTLLEG
jgi:hypothetical protein